MHWSNKKIKLESIKKTLYKYQNKKCAYCKRKFKRNQLTLDHVVPQARGGAKYEIHNLVLACLECNQAKADDPAINYESELRRYSWLRLPKRKNPKILSKNQKHQNYRQNQGYARYAENRH